MWVLASAVVTASLLGSMHCVGMCGPLAIWASGAGDRISTAQMSLATTLYHLGRLLTYAVVGLLAGAAGQLIDFGGQALGLQLFAARSVGGLMIVFGLLRLVQLLRKPRAPQKNFSGPAPQPNWVTRQLLKLRPIVFRLPVPARGLVTGLLTAFLPCGWLYLFALVAAGTGSMLMGSLVMTAFWLGSVPALVGLVTGTQALALRFQRIIPVGAAVVLIVGGGYTATGRGFASLKSLSDIRISGSTDFARVYAEPNELNSGHASIAPSTGRSEDIASGLGKLLDSPLPCCETPEVAAPQTPRDTASINASRNSTASVTASVTGTAAGPASIIRRESHAP